MTYRLLPPFIPPTISPTSGFWKWIFFHRARGSNALAAMAARLGSLKQGGEVGTVQMLTQGGKRKRKRKKRRREKENKRMVVAFWKGVGSLFTTPTVPMVCCDGCEAGELEAGGFEIPLELKEGGELENEKDKNGDDCCIWKELEFK